MTTATATRTVAIQLFVGAAWTTIGKATGIGTPDGLFREWAVGKAAHEVVATDDEFGYRTYSVGAARFRLIPCKADEIII